MATPAPAPKTAPVDDEADADGKSAIPAVVTLSIAGAGAVLGGIFGVLALGSKSDFEAAPSQELFDKTERNTLIADMSFGVALTFGVTGLVLLLSDEEPDTTASTRPFVAPWVGPNGGGAVGTLRF